MQAEMMKRIDKKKIKEKKKRKKKQKTSVLQRGLQSVESCLTDDGLA